MVRSTSHLVTGLALLAALALAWASGGKAQDTQSKAPDSSALAREVQELRKDLLALAEKVESQGAANEALLAKLAEWKLRAEQADAITRALMTRVQTIAGKLGETQAALDHPQPSRTAPAASAAAVSDTSPARGRITKIDPVDSTVIEINLGKEAGLEKHNTLEAFGPGPEYIGTLRIFEVYSQRAVCRLVCTNPLKKLSPKVGDSVR